MQNESVLPYFFTKNLAVQRQYHKHTRSNLTSWPTDEHFPT